jgi:hypothetical protein
MRRRSGAWLARALLLALIALALGGCFVVSWLPGRRDTPPAVSGPAPYVEGCQGCHAAAAGYAESVHAAKGIRCGQCHRPGGHPDYTEPVRDATCAGCHQPQYEQAQATMHFATREPRALDGDRAARKVLRRDGFTAAGAGTPRFVGDASSGAPGGRLCAACHYDEHRLGLRAVQQAEFCVGCHAAPQLRSRIPPSDLTNPCMACHTRIGTTERGQVLNTHRITRSGVGH